MNLLESKYLYLGLLILSVSYPLAQSFEWRISLYKNWKPIFLSIFIMMLLFIPWDVWFAKAGVWWFSNEYILGVKFLGLPVEEWLFFIVVPYACVFIYEVLNFYIKKDVLGPVAPLFFTLLGILLIVFSILYFPKYYTSITFGITGFICLFIAFTKPIWAGRFLLTYLVSLLPFLLVNGLLTGSFTNFPIVNYNTKEIIGFRIFTIPVEDSVYSFLMLLIVIYFFEKFRSYKTV